MNADEKFERQASEALKAGADGLDAHIRSRLTQARFAAVEEARKARAGFEWRTWVPAGSLAVAAVLAVALWSGRSPQETGNTAPAVAVAQSPMDDFELLTTNENFELLEELEFYAWVEDETDGDTADVG
jgi:anti-sigma-K factor RskA